MAWSGALDQPTSFADIYEAQRSYEYGNPSLGGRRFWVTRHVQTDLESRRPWRRKFSTWINALFVLEMVRLGGFGQDTIMLILLMKFSSTADLWHIMWHKMGHKFPHQTGPSASDFVPQKRALQIAAVGPNHGCDMVENQQFRRRGKIVVGPPRPVKTVPASHNKALSPRLIAVTVMAAFVIGFTLDAGGKAVAGQLWPFSGMLRMSTTK